tara:strand:+ start:160 stop:429 length:270 start_codon:yes stop_codon:yes gene_type:complete
LLISFSSFQLLLCVFDCRSRRSVAIHAYSGGGNTIKLFELTLMSLCCLDAFIGAYGPNQPHTVTTICASRLSWPMHFCFTGQSILRAGC